MKTMLHLVAVTLFTLSAASSLSQNGNRCVSGYLNSHKFGGSIEHIGSSEYEDTLAIDNKRVVVEPAIVLVPRCEKDVVLAVEATRFCNMSFSVISGGHSAAGYCLSGGGVTLDIGAGMKDVHLLADNDVGGNVRVESGALWEDIYRVTNTTDFLPVGGGCTTVGSGFLLGGGWSFFV